MSKKENVKAFNIRLEFDTWLFLKKYAAEQDKNMCSIIVEYVKKLKNKHEKDLTCKDVMVQ